MIIDQADRTRPVSLTLSVRRDLGLRARAFSDSVCAVWCLDTGQTDRVRWSVTEGTSAAWHLCGLPLEITLSGDDQSIIVRVSGQPRSRTAADRTRSFGDWFAAPSRWARLASGLDLSIDEGAGELAVIVDVPLVADDDGRSSGKLSSVTAMADGRTTMRIAHASDLRQLRRFIAARLDDEEITGAGARADLTLLTSELATNALRHADAEGGVTVSLTRDMECVRVGVTDGRPDLMPRTMPASDTSMSGRGLRMVTAMSSAWGTLVAGDHKTVWFEYDLGDTPVA